MRKLTLDLDAIQVCSFTTDVSPITCGTVLANRAKTERPECPVANPQTNGLTACGNHTCGMTCEAFPTECYSYESCHGTCPMGATCHPTCHHQKCRSPG
ncbi:MAG TPA: hypothetical protein VEX86_20205 [Longimicrobium sp.]|nr:hypothetical protein [Longimicrobium sp.]